MEQLISVIFHPALAKVSSTYVDLYLFTVYVNENIMYIMSLLCRHVLYKGFCSRTEVVFHLPVQGTGSKDEKSVYPSSKNDL
jgi:hypothetical protein